MALMSLAAHFIDIVPCNRLYHLYDNTLTELEDDCYVLDHKCA
jgi:hypothetical protein